MASRICPVCNGRGNVVVVVNGQRHVIICARCDGTGEVEIEDQPGGAHP